MNPQVRFVQQNPTLFIELRKAFEKAGAKVEMEKDWDSKTEKYITTELPEVKCYDGPKGEGFYINSSQLRFDIPKEELKNIFPLNIGGFEFTFATFMDAEFEDDRVWKSSVSFIVTKETKNILD
jgi:hypothetical protein